MLSVLLSAMCQAVRHCCRPLTVMRDYNLRIFELRELWHAESSEPKALEAGTYSEQVKALTPVKVPELATA